MASVLQRDGVWYVRFKDGTGRWKKQVTTAHTKSERGASPKS
jgi:hypothetical protein